MDDLAYVNAVAADSKSAKPVDEGTQTNGAASAIPETNFSVEELRETLNEALKVASTTSEDDIANLDQEAITLLLGKLDQADDVTAGLEDKLDALLGQLDGMIESMQQIEGSRPPSQTAAGTTTEQSPKPPA